MFKYVALLIFISSCMGNGNNEEELNTLDQYRIIFPATTADTLWNDFHNAISANDQEALLAMSTDSIDCIICEFFLETGKERHNTGFFLEDSLCRKAFKHYGST